MSTVTITLAGANEYHGLRVSKGSWEGFSTAERTRGLVSAQDALMGYSDRISIPMYYNYAVYEQALWMLAGGIADNQEQGVSSFGLSGISQSYDLKGRPGHVAPKAWRFIKGNIKKCGRIF